MNAISSIEQTRGSTAIGDGIVLGVDMASSIPDKKRVLLLLSDGTHNSGFATTTEATKYAINNNVQIHTVGIGSEKPIFLRNDIYGEPQYVKLDEDTLMNISQQTGGSYFKSSNPEAVILPISGKGLWSTLYGYFAIDSDYNTVKGITFYNHGETPGLGAEIEKDWFQITGTPQML